MKVTWVLFSDSTRESMAGRGINLEDNHTIKKFSQYYHNFSQYFHTIKIFSKYYNITIFSLGSMDLWVKYRELLI